MVDVLVTGAGPAGIAASKTLIESGAKVTLIDRHVNPGGKACAGGLTEEAWVGAGIDPLMPPSYAEAHLKIGLSSELGKTHLDKCGDPILVTVDRSKWQMECVDSLRIKGATVALGERLLEISNNVAITSKGRRKFDWLVGADGASSRTRRLVGLKQGSTIWGRQVRIKASIAADSGIDVQMPQIWFDSSIPRPGYGWSFPRGEEVRLGIGAPAELLGEGELKAVFDRWLKKRGLNMSDGEVETGTIGCGYFGYRFGKVILAGDAAGLASPLTGEGIAQALISGQEVAKEIIDPAYRSKKIARLAKRHRRTGDTLASCFLGGPAMTLAPYLLRVPSIRKETLKRYV